MKRQRPPIPDRVKIVVACRQLLEAGFPKDLASRGHGETQRRHLARLLNCLSVYMGEKPRDLTQNIICGNRPENLHCDHNPALRVRPYNPRIKIVAARYTPNANDPDYLIWRSRQDHHIKTNVRGDGAQHPDRVLIKKLRRIEKRRKPRAAGRKRRRPVMGRQKLTARGGLTSCRLGSRCQCPRRERKSCGHWRTQKIKNRRSR